MATNYATTCTRVLGLAQDRRDNSDICLCAWRARVARRVPFDFVIPGRAMTMPAICIDLGGVGDSGRCVMAVATVLPTRGATEVIDSTLSMEYGGNVRLLL